MNQGENGEPEFCNFHSEELDENGICEQCKIEHDSEIINGVLYQLISKGLTK